MSEQVADAFELARRRAGLSHAELYLRYFELGGMSSAFQLEAIACGALRPSGHDHDVIAQALNERLVELGSGHPVAYFADDHEPSEQLDE